MPRFFVESDNIKDDVITLYGDDAGHISRVLRSEKGEVLTVCDGTGMDYEAEITDISEKEIKLKILSSTFTVSEPSVKITLYQSLPKGDKMELIIQKCVELGVSKIVPVNSERCIVKLDHKKEKKKLERWRKISESAAKQSGRGIVPEIGEVMSFSNAVKEAENADKAAIFYELEEERGLKKFLDEGVENPKTMAVFVGPEGGFAVEETELAKNAGFDCLTLGKRILRTETAGMCAVANILFYLDM